MQYTHHMISNFISDSVMQKFLRFAYAKFLKSFFLKNAWAESNFDSYQFSLNIAFHAYAIIIFMRIVGKINIDPISMHISRCEILR